MLQYDAHHGVLLFKVLSFFHWKMQVGCLFAVAVGATAPGGWGVPAGEGGDISGGGQARPGQQTGCVRPDPPVPQCHNCWSQAAVGQHQHGEGREWDVTLDTKSGCSFVSQWQMECAVKWIPSKLGNRQGSVYNGGSESAVWTVCRLMELTRCM